MSPCRAGIHELDGEGVYTRPNGKRECRACKAGQFAAWDAARRGRRYPLQPLLDAAGMTLGQFARRYGISGTTRQSAVQGGLRPDTADRWACKAGLNPAEVWPSWIDDQLADVSRPCADCGDLFVSTRKGTRYCPGEECRAERHRRQARESARKRYAESAEVRARRLANAAATRPGPKARRAQPSQSPERRRASRAAYYARHRETLLARKRARYAEAKKAA